MAQREPQSLQNLGSIITQINNNKHVTASFSPLKSSWVILAWGYFIYFLSFPSPPSSPPSPLLLQTTLAWSVMQNNNQVPDRHRAWAPSYRNSVVQVIKVTLQSERNKNLLCFYKWGMACTWAFLQNPNRNKRDKTICLLWWWKTTMLCFSSSSVDAFTNREQWFMQQWTSLLPTPQHCETNLLPCTQCSTFPCPAFLGGSFMIALKPFSLVPSPPTIICKVHTGKCSEAGH